MDPDWTFRWKETRIEIDPARIEALAEEFRLDFLEASLAMQPDNVEVLVDLGELYTGSGRYVEGLEIDRKLVKLLPDNATVHYNFACSLALMGESDRAIKALRTAIHRGFTDFEHMREDPDLQRLHGAVEFEALLELAREALS
ncbi:MAG: TPR end-of-group domain-containing protein [Planctomycetota bacterium]